MAEKAPLRIRLSVPYEKALEMARAALKTEGFGVLTEIDVKETLKAKIGADFRKYDILGACNPSIAFMGLQRHLELGLLLPCNVIVYEEGDGSVVSIQDPGEMLAVTNNPELEEVATIARGHLERVIAALEGAR
ncbi:MAG TPA: DUF302 domain-containing protein [Dehalococcoidia bacterium]|nr:DUF302 domain-containing protein [Dehalococcoidia bacterium]